MATPAAQERVSRIDRTPPHSVEAEQGVLGSILLNAERVIDLAVENQLRSESFYVPAHRDIFEVCVDLQNNKKPADLINVIQALRDKRLLAQIGGDDYLQKILLATPTDAHAEYYIDIVRQKYVLRQVIDRARQAIDSCFVQEMEADSILDTVEQSFYDIAENQRQTMVPWPQAVKETMVVIEKIIQEKREITGIPTGYIDLDRMTKGFQPGDMIIIAARPSMGKTSLAMNMAEHIATGNTQDREKRAVAVFSLEMSTDALVKRMLCSRAGVPYHKLTGGFVSKDHHSRLISAADALSRSEIYVDDTPGLEPTELRARARRLKRNKGIQVIVVDYLQMMNFSKLARDGRQREVAAISGSLKAMAKELKVPVIVLSQLSRAPESRDKTAKPKLSDLRDSGSIEQDADVVCLLRRPCRYPDDPESGDTTLAIVDVAKHRNGPTGEVRLNFIDELTRFENRAHGVDEPREEPPQP